MPKHNPTTRPWRQLVRVEYAPDDDTEMVGLVIPGFDGGRQIIKRCKHTIPADVWEYMRNHIRLFARVNIGADESKDLVFRDWEMPD